MSSYAACHHDVEAPINSDNHGVFFLNSRIQVNDITDGCSTTIFIGEKRNRADDLTWMSGTRASLRNTGSPINTANPVDPGSSPSAVGGFGSWHPKGGFFSFGDGSVRFLKETIDAATLRRLGNRADGELVNEGPY